MEDFEEFVDFVERAQLNRRVPKRYLRDFENPLEQFSDEEFKRRFRFSKGIVRDKIFILIEDALRKTSNRGLPVSPMHQLLLALRYYATGSFQVVCGDLSRRISQPTVSCIIKRVSIALASHFQEYVRFPENHMQHLENMAKFKAIARFPNVTCCIDGTHIPIKNPGGAMGEVFRNRKGQFSLNVQVACGPNMEILDVVARYPGSTHDNVIFDRSSLRVRYENNTIPGIILGDNGYSCRRYLLTPVLEPNSRAERRYNTAHRATRNIVERVFGVWKSRFRCLHKLTTKLETSVTVICALAVLHNIAICENDDIIVDENENIEINNLVDDNAAGNAYRTAFIHIHFGQNH